MQQRAINAARSKAATIDPITIPAITPPERPLLDELADESVGLVVLLGVNVMFGMGDKVGRMTPAQIPAALDP